MISSTFRKKKTLLSRPPISSLPRETFSLIIGLLILSVLVSDSQSMMDPYLKRYSPFQVVSQAQLLRPSIPFPGILEFSTPKAEFFAKVRTSKNAPAVIKPQLTKDFGKKRYIHYNKDIFLPNEGIDFLALRKNFNFKEMTSEMLTKVLEEQLEGLGDGLDFPMDDLLDNTHKKKKKQELPKYYQNLLSEYDPKINFYDNYSRNDYYIDMLKFLNKMKTSVDFYSNPTTDPNSTYFHGVGKLIVRKLNKYRRRVKLRDNVVWSEPMYYYMMEHSVYMSRIHKLTHDGFNSRSNYVKKMYSLKASAENLASFQTFSLMTKEEIAERFMQLWINSKGHRLNMEKDFNMCSVAVYKTPNEEYYATMFLIRI